MATYWLPFKEYVIGEACVIRPVLKCQRLRPVCALFPTPAAPPCAPAPPSVAPRPGSAPAQKALGDRTAALLAASGAAHSDSLHKPVPLGRRGSPFPPVAPPASLNSFVNFLRDNPMAQFSFR